MIIKNNQIDLIVEKLKNDEVVCFPTETVMGLGVRFDSIAAYDKLLEVKCRPTEKAFPLIVKDLKEIEKYGYIDEKIKKIIIKYMPGPLTLILKKKESIEDWMNSGQDTIAIRIPQSEVLLAVLTKLNSPMFLTSANYSGAEPALTDLEVQKIFGSELLIVEGKAEYKMASTIVDVSSNMLKLVRRGSIPFEDIVTCYEEDNT